MGFFNKKKIDNNIQGGYIFLSHSREDIEKVREIDAREWFVFANSENSRKSRWVTFACKTFNGRIKA